MNIRSTIIKGPKLDVSFQERRDDLSRLIAKLNSRKIYLQRMSKSYSNYRLLIFLISLIIFFILFFLSSGIAALIWFIFFVCIFSIVAHYHAKLDRGIKKLELWIKIKIENLARMNLNWENIPPLSNF